MCWLISLCLPCCVFKMIGNWLYEIGLYVLNLFTCGLRWLFCGLLVALVVYFVLTVWCLFCGTCDLCLDLTVYLGLLAGLFVLRIVCADVVFCWCVVWLVVVCFNSWFYVIMFVFVLLLLVVDYFVVNILLVLLCGWYLS